MRHSIFLSIIMALGIAAFAADLTVPSGAQFGTALAIGTSGNGSGTLYLVGPVARIKRTLRLGETLKFPPEEIRASGMYTAVLQSQGRSVSKSFFISPGEVRKLNFLAQPSRVPTDAKDAISGTVVLRDQADNVSLAPARVTFTLAVAGGAEVVRTAEARNGVAWSRLDSSRRAGNARFTAAVGEVSVPRVVQQVAGEPCDLRFHAQSAKSGILVQTDPVRDCAGNPVPDGMIVSFASLDARGKSSVDAVVKTGIAQAILPPSDQSTLSVAAGVVSGNEIRWKGTAE